MVADEAAYVDAGVDAGLNAIPYDSAKLAPLGLDEAGGNILLIQPEISYLGAGTKVAVLPYYAVTYIVVVGYFTALHDNRVLDLHRSTNVTVVADGGAGADEAIGTYIAVVPDYNRPLNI